MSGSPSCQCPAAISRVDDSRTWAAVTSVSSSSGPRRTASRTAVQRGAARLQRGDHRVRPARDHLRWPFPRPYTWQNNRSGLVAASGRSQLLTSTASRIRPSGQPAAAAPPAPGAAARSPPGRGSPRHTRRRARAGAPAPATAPQGLHRPVRAQHRIRQLEQRIRPRRKAPVQLPRKAASRSRA